MIKYAIYFTTTYSVTGKDYQGNKKELVDGYISAIHNDGTIQYCTSKKDAIKSNTEQSARILLNKVRKYAPEHCKCVLLRFDG